MKGEYSGGYERSGKAHESFLLGEVRREDPQYNQKLKALGADARGYLPFYLAQELAMEFQPMNRSTYKEQDPINPEKMFPKDLRLEIAETLSLESDEDLNRLKYYTAVGSPLDLFHGVDAFIVLEGKNPGDKRVMVTFDVTLKTEASAKQDAKADVIIRELESPIDPESKKIYYRQIADLAAKAADFLKNPRA